MSEFLLCEAIQADEPAPLRCDRPRGHSGRHAEIYVATWARDGSDLRWNIAGAFERPHYKADA